ncbi:hypothetical protein DSM112329_03316 [Paraconexibacter sp. AEG42_29]|uniref:Uncharacterized protein n=1 Tax=Paraconexibacter sp. AEG42_29 TaxID=2997339 RepID=A0AAU7AXK9_9ACTN
MRTFSIAAVLSTVVLAGLAFAPSAGALSGCGYASGYSVRVNAQTSCGFARNVARAFSQGRYRPRVYSPATGRYYTMNCRGSYRSAYCTGANRAFVSLQR